jgi:hypothetical protein
MSGRLGGDWANPLQGHADAAPPSSVMNERRLIRSDQYHSSQDRNRCGDD